MTPLFNDRSGLHRVVYDRLDTTLAAITTRSGLR